MAVFPPGFVVSPEVQDGIRAGLPIVALESTLITHGLPKPDNLETALEAELAVRTQEAIPATIAVLNGIPTIGLTKVQLRELAESTEVMKASRRDLGVAVALGRTAGTTVSATMALAHMAGIRVFATGGIGGVHRRTNPSDPLDVSADLVELSRTPVLVVCAGAKSILDLPHTLETLETLGVPVWGFRTNDFPAFTTRGSGGKVSQWIDSPRDAARVFTSHVRLGGAGAVFAQPVNAELAVPADVFEKAYRQAESEAAQSKITGPAVTPFLLKRLAELTGGKTLPANKALIVANARLAAQVAKELGTGRG